MRVLCPFCSYDVTNLPAAQSRGECPECGRLALPKELRDANVPPFFAAPLRNMCWPTAAACLISCTGARLVGGRHYPYGEISLIVGFVAALAATFYFPSAIARRRAAEWGVSAELHVDEMFIGASVNMAMLFVAAMFILGTFAFF